MALSGLALVVASCAAGDDGSEDLSGDGNTQGQDSGGDDNSNDDAGGDTVVLEIDPSKMPPPGEAQIEVDGQVINLSESEMEHFTCEIRDDGISVNFQSGSQSPLFLQGASQPDGSILASVTVHLEDQGVRYDSSNAGGRSGGVATEGAQLLYVGEFDVTPLDDPGNITAVGEGSVSVTCS